MKSIRTLLRKKLMLWIGAAIGFLFFLSAILVIYIGTRSDEWWSETVSSQLSKSLERKVDIQGDFHLDFGRIISVEASSVRISNPAWRESPDMLRLGKLLLEFDTFSLFGKTILIPRLELADIELELVENQDGKKNWIFGADSEQLSDSPSVSRPGKSITLPVGIEQLSLQNSRISLQQPGRERPLILQVDAITGSTDANGKAVFDGDGQLNELPYSLHALIEPGETGFNLRPSKLTVGEYQVTAEGHISVTDQLQAELDVTGAGPDLSLITRLVNTIQLPAWPFQAKGKMVITTQQITLSNVSGTAGKHSVEVDGPIDYTGSLQLDAKARGPSLQAVLNGLGYDVIPASAPYEAEAKIEIANNQLTVTAKQARLGPAKAVAKLNIPDLNSPAFLKVDVGELRTTDISASLAVVGLKLKLPRVMPANVTGQIEWNKNAARLSRVRGSIDTTNFNIDGTIGGPPNYYNTRMNIEIDGENLEHFLASPAEKAIPFQVNGVVSRDKRYTRFEKVQLNVADIQASVLGQ
ncbi:MAG: AsmA family protein, partial [Thiohalophilus sp.]